MASYVEIEGVEPIGRSGFAEVRFCSRIDDGEPFAKKILVQDDTDSQRLRREVEILRLIGGPKIMPVIDADLDANPPYYIMPLYNASLRSILPALRWLGTIHPSDVCDIDKSRIRDGQPPLFERYLSIAERPRAT